MESILFPKFKDNHITIILLNFFISLTPAPPPPFNLLMTPPLCVYSVNY